MQPTTRADREAQREAASERRKTRRLWRRQILARVAGGESRVEIAAETGGYCSRRNTKCSSAKPWKR